MTAPVDLPSLRLVAPISPSSIFPATPSAIDRTGSPWDDHQRAWILDLRSRGLGAEAVAAALGRSIETIYAQYQLLGSRIFARRTWTAAEATRAIARAQAGEPLKIIAADFGRTADQLRGMFETRGYRPGRRPDWSEADLALLRTRLTAGDTCAAIGTVLGRSAASVRHKASVLGLAAVRPAKVARIKPARQVGSGTQRASQAGGCRWDVAAEARLAALVAAEGPEALASIAAAMGSTPRMVRAKALALNLVARKRARRGLTADGEALVRRLAATTPITAMSRAVGCDLRTLKAWAEGESIVFAKAERTKAERPKAKPMKASPAVRAKPLARPQVEQKPDRGSRAAALELAAIAAEARQAARVSPEKGSAGTASSAGSAWKARRIAPNPIEARASREIAVAAPVEAARGQAVAVRFVPPPPPPEPSAQFRQYRRPNRAAPADAATLLRDTGDAIAAFLATRGVTKVQLEPRAELEAAVRRRGYALVSTGSGYLVDGHIALDTVDALRAFAERRRIAA